MAEEIVPTPSLKWRFEEYICNFVLAILTAIPLLPALLGAAIGPWSQFRAMPPYNGLPITSSWNVLQADACLQFYVWRDLVFHSWQKLQIPLWNPYILNGTPLLANSQSGAMYPPHILIGVFHIPTAIGMGLLAWGHLFLAAFGTKLFLSGRQVSNISSTVAGAAFGLSPMMISWTPLPSVIETFSWLPLALFAISRAIRSCEKKEISWKSAKAISFAAFTIQMPLLAGHLQFATYLLIGCFCFFIFEVASIRIANREHSEKFNFQKVGLFAVAVAVLVFVSVATQVIPVLKMGQQSHRKTSPSIEAYQGYISGANKLPELVGIVSPELLGLKDIPPSDSSHPPLTGYWPAYQYPGSSFAETSFTLTPIVFFFLLAGGSTAIFRKELGLVVIGGFGLLLAFGSPLNLLLYFGLPGWAATGSPGRASCLFVFAMCALVGPCMDQALKLNWRQIGMRGFLPTFGLIAISLVILQEISFSNEIVNAIKASAVPQITMSLIALVGIILGLYIYKIPRSNIPVKLSTFLVPVFLSIGFLNYAYGMIPFDRETLPAISSNAQRIAIVNDNWSLITPPHAISPPNLATLSLIHQVGGYDSLIRKEAQNRLSDVDNADPSPPENGNMMNIKSTFDPAKLAELGVTEVWSLKPLSQLSTTPYVKGYYRYPLAGPGRASLNGQAIQIDHEDLNEVTFKAVGPGKFILRDDLSEDWQLTIDGQPAAFQNQPWPTFNLPAGLHEIVYSIHSPLVSFFAPLVFLPLLIVFVSGYILRRKRNPDTL